MNVRGWMRQQEVASNVLPKTPSTGGSQLEVLALSILEDRERRLWFLPKAAFGETAWEILLLLYVSDSKSLSLESLFNATLTEPSTGMRWVEFLQDEGFVSRCSSNSGEVQLSLKGTHSLELYLLDRSKRTQIKTSRDGTADGEIAARRVGQTAVLAGLVGAVAAALTCSLAA